MLSILLCRVSMEDGVDPAVAVLVPQLTTWMHAAKHTMSVIVAVATLPAVVTENCCGVLHQNEACGLRKEGQLGRYGVISRLRPVIPSHEDECKEE